MAFNGDVCLERVLYLLDWPSKVTLTTETR